MLLLSMRKTGISKPAGSQEKSTGGKTQTNGIARTWRKLAKTIPTMLQRNQSFSKSTVVNIWGKQITGFIFFAWAWFLIQKILRHWYVMCHSCMQKSVWQHYVIFQKLLSNFYLRGNLKQNVYRNNPCFTYPISKCYSRNHGRLTWMCYRFYCTGIKCAWMFIIFSSYFNII